MYILYHVQVSRGSSVTIVSGYGLDDRAIEVRSPTEAKICFPLASVSRSALGPIHPPVQWVPEVKRGRGVTLTIRLHLVPRSRMSRSYTPLPQSAFLACGGTDLALAVSCTNCMHDEYGNEISSSMKGERIS
jgi:hypothetical protein